MPTLYVTYITLDASDSDRRIAAIGGPDFYHASDDVIRNIQDERHIYYTLVGTNAARIEVGRHPVSGCLFLQTQGDDYPYNSLVQLPACG
jgi:hypothetical protein